MFNKDDQPNQINLRLTDVIKEQQKTIDKLTDKLIAKNLPEYKSLQGEVPERPVPEENPWKDLDDIEAEEAQIILNDSPQLDTD